MTSFYRVTVKVGEGGGSRCNWASRGPEFATVEEAVAHADLFRGLPRQVVKMTDQGDHFDREVVAEWKIRKLSHKPCLIRVK